MLAGCDLILGSQKTLKARVCCLEAALTEVRLDVVGVQVLVNLRAFALRHAVHRPGINVVGGFREVRARLNVPVLGGDNRVVAVVVVLYVFANQSGNVRTALGGEGAAGAEIVLHVNNNQCLRHVCPLQVGMSFHSGSPGEDSPGENSISEGWFR